MTGQDVDPATGLTPAELSEVFENNPRAYMAVRGAVAEKHLDKVVAQLVEEGAINDYRTAAGDHDKDFYLQVNGVEVSLECKNVEVIKTNTKAKKASYLRYLEDEKLLPSGHLESSFQAHGLEGKGIDDLSGKELDEMIKGLPQSSRESGMIKYQFSASKLEVPRVGEIADDQFVRQFEGDPLTIDFQRTRNSTDKDGDARRNRFYKHGEIDIVGACLFSRTLEWKFLFAKAEEFPKHDKYPDRFKNSLKLEPGVWVSDIRQLL